ncbi:MAG TPA: isocitrate/isopropylmalate family dehydrogenase, partial [Flavobacteriales bacterium]|nr:isocitrate/isopropylmalate family dehydrogenase [Flavobacteriales bacterium]
GSANIGDRISMFEAIHGSAPDIASMGIANPSAMLNAACMMLVHLGLPEKALAIQNAWLKTLEDGIHPGDIFREGLSKHRTGTKAFADAVIARLGQKPAELKSVEMKGGGVPKFHYERPAVRRELCGVDMFVCDPVCTPDELAAKLLKAAHGVLKLKLITNRGVKVWPEGVPETFCTDHWRCRFVGPEVLIDDGKAAYRPIGRKQVVQLMHLLTEAGIEVVKTENFYLIDGVRGFSLGQGE